jgi:hypothetical protein
MQRTRKRRNDMQTILSTAVACLAAAGLIQTAAAQTIYRCGNSYGTQPCPGGTVVESPDRPGPGQAAQTSAAVKRDARAADTMEKARIRQEATPAQAYIPAPRSADESDARREPGKSPAIFRATAPAKPGEAPAKKTRPRKRAS